MRSPTFAFMVLHCYPLCIAVTPSLNELDNEGLNMTSVAVRECG